MKNGVASISGLMLLLTAVGARADWALYKSEDWFDLNAHLRIAGGSSSGSIEDAATHGHDPSGEFTVQGLELEPTLQFNDHILISGRDQQRPFG